MTSNAENLKKKKHSHRQKFWEKLAFVGLF